MTFSKILCPTDFSDGSRQAVRVAARLAGDNDAELVLVHAWHVPPMMYAGEFVFPSPVLGQMQDDAQRALDGAVAQAAADGAKRVRAVLVSGVPWVEIVDVLEKQPFDLCVMATHGRTGLSRVLLGSVAEKVVRHAPCSVLAVRPDTEAKPFRHILVPTDFTESAANALEVAGKLVSPGGTGITVLHVIEVPVSYSGQMRVAEFARDLDKRSTEALDDAAARIRRHVGVPVTTSSRVGYAGAQTLAELDADPSVDLVVMGSHGRTGIKRVLLGSVAEKIVRHAKCPVLVTRKR